MKIAAGYVLMACAGTAWYLMAHIIFLDVFERDVLPIGKPWFEKDNATQSVAFSKAARN